MWIDLATRPPRFQTTRTWPSMSQHVSGCYRHINVMERKPDAPEDVPEFAVNSVHVNLIYRSLPLYWGDGVKSQGLLCWLHAKRVVDRLNACPLSVQAADQDGGAGIKALFDQLWAEEQGR